MNCDPMKNSITIQGNTKQCSNATTDFNGALSIEVDCASSATPPGDEPGSVSTTTIVLIVVGGCLAGLAAVVFVYKKKTSKPHGLLQEHTGGSYDAPRANI